MTLLIMEVADEAKVAELRRDPALHIVREIPQSTVIGSNSPLRWYGALAGSDAETWDQHLKEMREDSERDVWPSA